MESTRRKILAIGSGSLAFASMAGLPTMASLADEAMAAFVDDAEIVEGGVELTAPEIAEDGYTVPIQIAAPGAVMVALFAEENPVATIATFKFGKLNPSHSASTRIRLSGTQNIVAIAKMPDGTFRRTSASVQVTIGGCGA